MSLFDLLTFLTFKRVVADGLSGRFLPHLLPDEQENANGNSEESHWKQSKMSG
jgi:hypothetical protein